MEKVVKKAPSKTPLKQGWKITFSVIMMCLWVFVSVVAAQFVVGVILGKLVGSEVNQPVWTAVFSATSYVLALALVIVVPIKWTKTSRRELGLAGWPTWTDIGLAPVGFIASLILAAGLVALFSLFPWFDAEQAQNVGFSAYMGGFDRIVAFITLVVVAPVAEEIIFRGWLYGKIRERLGDRVPERAGVVIATLMVSTLFGIAHMQWNVGLNVFALSVVLCIMREITGTIYAGILTHMVKNGVAFYLLYVLGIG